jgi:hypothetical protein
MKYILIIFLFVCGSVSAQRINYGILPTIDSISATDYFPALRAPNSQYKATYQALIDLMQDSITGGGATWGTITGDLDTQADLYTALNLKLPISDTAAMMKRDTTSCYLLADTTTTSTTAVGTGLKFQIAANERYVVEVNGTASKATSNTGLKLAIGAPTSCTIKGYAQQGAAALSTAMTNSLITAINTLGNTFATGIGVEVPFRLVFTVTNGANAGVIELQFATVTSNTATIFAGTNMRWQRTKGL